MEEKLDGMDRLQRNDHDTLIRLEGKVDSLIINVATLQTGIDTRIKTLEVDLKVLGDKVEKDAQWIHDFNHTYKVMGGLAAGVSSIITFLLTVIALKSELFK